MATGGEEVNGIVVDLGTHTCKVGYAGEDTPKFVFSSQIGRMDGSAGGDIEMLPEGAKQNRQVIPSGWQCRLHCRPSKDALGLLDPTDLPPPRSRYRIGDMAMSFPEDGMDVVSPFQDGVFEASHLRAPA